MTQDEPAPRDVRVVLHGSAREADGLLVAAGVGPDERHRTVGMGSVGSQPVCGFGVLGHLREGVAAVDVPAVHRHGEPPVVQVSVRDRGRGHGDRPLGQFDRCF